MSNNADKSKNITNNPKNSIEKNNKVNHNNNDFIQIFLDIKDWIVSTSYFFNQNNIEFYLIYFTIFFFLYYTLTAKYVNSAFDNYFEKNKKNGWFIFFYTSTLLLLIIGFSAYYSTKLPYLDDQYNRLKVIIFGILVIFIFFNCTQVFFKYMSIYLPDWFLRGLLYLFLIFNVIFFVFYLNIFIININQEYNIENCIAMELLLFFYLINIANVRYNKSFVYDSLNKNDFNYLTINCLDRSGRRENYQNDKKSIQLDNISKEYGNDYLQLLHNIPVKYKNKNTGKYEDLLLCDFYYPGSYNTFVANSPLNGTPDTYAIELALKMYKVRVVTLDIFSDSKNEFSQSANPIVRSINMKEGKKGISIDSCFETINKYAWIPNNNNEIAYPLFLVLNFYFDDNNKLFYNKIKEKIYNYFKKYLIDKRYSFNGYNGTNFISKAPMNECLGKIIIITNKYPAESLNELINCSIKSNKLVIDSKNDGNNKKNKEKEPSNNSISLYEYKPDFVNYEKVGVSQDHGKTELFKKCQDNIVFFHTNPNNNYDNKEQSKAGLFNPRFRDVAQYGVQGTLMNLFIPDKNFKEWENYFLNKSNYDPVLKSESLRNTHIHDEEIKGADPMIGIQKDQKYCLMGNSDYMATNTGNMSTSNTNNSCDAK